MIVRILIPAPATTRLHAPALLTIVLGTLLGVTAHSADAESLPDPTRGFVFERRPAVAAAGLLDGAETAEPRCVQPRALAAGDLDEDGIDDLVVGCVGPDGHGVALVHRGRIEAVYPALRRGSAPRAPFAPAHLAARIDGTADWIGVGDLDGDGHQDVVTTGRGSRQLQLLRGDGRGRLGEPELVSLPGPVLEAVLGEIDRRDGWPDLVVAVADGEDTRVLVFRTPHGALAGPPEGCTVPGRVAAMALGPIDGDAARDLAVAGERGLTLIHGRDRSGYGHGFRLEPGLIAVPLTGVAVADLLPGASGRAEIAVSEGNGRVRVLRRLGDDTAGTPASWELVDGTAALDRSAVTALGPAHVGLVPARISGGPSVGLVMLDRAAGRLLALATAPSTATAVEAGAVTRPASLALDPTPLAAKGAEAAVPVTSPGGEIRSVFRDPAVLASDATPLVVLPMRLGPDAIDDLVVLEIGQGAPAVLTSVVQSTFVVTSMADTDDGNCDADCTLREAINAANASVGPDLIAFDLPGPPPYTIQPLTELPTLTEAVTVDGTTEPDFVDTPVVLLDGSQVTTAASFGGGLLLSGGASTVRGLACNGFTLNSCITVWTGGGNVVEGNFLGTDASGTAAVGALAGTNAIASSGNTFGGTVPAARNVIAAVAVPAIELREGSNDNLIQGNYIGLDVTGLVALPDEGTDVVIYDSEGNTFGGAADAARNVVSGGLDPSSISIGIATNDTDPATNAQDNLVLGNYVGTDVSGTVGHGTASAAVYILDAPGNTVGGAAGNVIVDAGLWGVAAVLAGATGTIVDGNLIGVGADGLTPLGNASDGVRLYLGAADSTVIGNTIAHSLGNGIALRADAGTGNTITGNAIFDNDLLGIDLGLDGPTANDPGDPDTGANLLQNFPLLVSVSSVTGVVSGRLGSTPSATFTVELFQSESCDGSGFGEGQLSVGSDTVVTDPAGDGAFSITVTAALTDGRVLTATATDTAGNTSELGHCVPVGLFVDTFESGNTSAWSSSVP